MAPKIGQGSPRARDSEVGMQVDEPSTSSASEDAQRAGKEGEEASASASAGGKSKGKEREEASTAATETSNTNGWSDQDGDQDGDDDDDNADSSRNPIHKGSNNSMEEALSPDLIASLPVYLSSSLPSTCSIHLFQYPIFNKENPLPVPSQARSAGFNETIRWRPRANRIEMELPIDDRPSVYNSERGRKFGKGAKMDKEIGEGSQWQDKVKKEKGRSKPVVNQDEKNESHKLRKTRLESNEIPHTTGYMVGVIRDGALHLTPLESIIQLRPSMHYLDELDRINKEAGRTRSKTNAGGEELSDVEMSEGGGGGGGGNQSPSEQKEAKPKAKVMAMHATVKPGDLTKGGPGDRDTLMKAQRLADGEAWVDLEWNGQESEESDNAFRSKLFASTKSKLNCTTRPREYLPQL